MRTLIRGGRVVTATEAFAADVLLDGEQIRAVGLDLEAQADETVDASGCYVLPGLVDNHTHLSMPFNGTVSCDDYTTGTAAAAAGGTTAIVDFSIQAPGGTLKDALAAWQERAHDAAHVDYGFHLAITDAEQAIPEMGWAVEQGVTTFKVFMAYKGELMVDDEQMLLVLQQTGQTGGLVLVHCENGDAVALRQRELFAAGHAEPRFHAISRPPAVEAEATGRALRLAEWAGRPMFIVHVTCEEAVREVQAARDRGVLAYGETCLQYLFLTEDDLARPGFEGAKFVCSPPLRAAHHREALYGAMRAGALQGLSTDHCPFNFAGQKEMGAQDFRLIPNGLPAIEHRLSVTYDGAVRSGRLTMPELVRLTSTEPARIFGLTRKGAIRPGGDADVVVFDPEATQTISARTHHMNVDYDPFEGLTVTGVPRMTFCRGTKVFADGEILTAPGHGRYTPRALFGPAQPTAPTAAATA